MNRELQKIANLMKAGRADQARAQLKQYLESSPDDGEAWYLRSFVEPDSAAKTAAARKAITLDPATEKYQKRLAKLQALQRARPQASRQSGRSRVAIVLVLIVALVALGVIAVVLSNRTRQETVAQVPTLIVLDTALPSFTPTESSAAAIVFTVTSEPAEAATDLPASTTEVQTADSTALPTTQTIASPPAGIVTLSASAQPLNNNDGATLLATQAPQSLPTAAPTTPRPQVAAPSVTPQATPTPVILPNLTDTGVPLTTGQSIGGGQMRVIEATRPGDSRIQELGGTIAGAPVGQSWILVEALLICSGEQSCAPAQAALNVLGSSGATYHAASQLQALPIFGSQFIGGQVWGYLAFAIPDEESSLRLVVTQGSQHYVFALQ